MNQASVELRSTTKRRWWQRIGPGLITACVVIGPGSILTSSQVGADRGYSMLWVVIVAVAFMALFMRLSARLGVVASESPGGLIAARLGRPAAVFVGLAVFFISASFQFGNNLGVHSAFRIFLSFDYTIVIFNLLTIVFLFSLRNLYQVLERLMSCFVGLMLIAFAANLITARPNVSEMLQGFIPRRGELDLAVLGLVGTTFVISAAFYQAYLVRQKGWTRDQLHDGKVDVRVGAVIMAAITLMLISTAATVLRGESLGSVQQVALGLKPLFGEIGTLLFCVGLFSAAYSSFLINSLIGGFILSDGLGLGSRPDDLWPRVFSAIILIVGMTMALLVIMADISLVPAIVAAQAVTVVAAPVLAAALWWLTSREDVMGPDRNSLVTNICAGVGLALLLCMAWYTVIAKILPAIAMRSELAPLLG